MSGHFVLSKDVDREKLDWGMRGWASRPTKTGAETLGLVEVDLLPGFGHAFHYHPNQEEIVYVVSGEVEQWIETRRQILKAGDSAFMEVGIVHASYNISNKPAKVLAIVGPCVNIGVDGYEVVEVAGEIPWNTLRTNP
ncbi:MAG: cupin domain-containing protein [Chloroflexi bacterium]|nr:cupin domain-containing protein [Chloroflexota bacterium]